MGRVVLTGSEVDGGIAAVAAIDLSVRFGDVCALAPVSFAVDAAEAIAIVGPSGAGKSTLLLALAGLVAPTAGSVEVGGRDLAVMSERERDGLRRRDLGFVFQAGELVPELTVVQNVALPLRLAGTKVSEALDLAHEALARLGIEHLGGRSIWHVSGGQVQRTAIARALVHSPRVVLADEPTGALDTQNAVAVIELLTQQCRERSAAVVLVTHDPSLAKRADRVIELRPADLA